MRTDRHQVWDRGGNLITDEAVEVDDTLELNEASVGRELSVVMDRLATEITTMQAIEGTSGNLTAAQLSNAARQTAEAVRIALQVERRLIRHAVRDFTADS
jgi:hypothetical protein